MNYYVIEVPQVDVGQVAGKNLLDLRVNLFALGLVHRGASPVDQTIDLRIDVIAAVGMLGRKARGVKGVIEDVGILVAANPAERVELKRSFVHVGIKRSELETAYIQRYSHHAELLLQGRGQQSRGFDRRSLH